MIWIITGIVLTFLAAIVIFEILDWLGIMEMLEIKLYSSKNDTPASQTRDIEKQPKHPEKRQGGEPRKRLR